MVFKKNETEEEQEEVEEEIEVPQPNTKKEEKETRILVVTEDKVPKVEAREVELEGEPVVIETIEEAITEIRNDIRTIRKSLTG